MLIHSHAELRLQSESLDAALREFLDNARRHLLAKPHSEIFISIGESGARINALLARQVPAATLEFYVGSLRVGAPLTASQFLDAIAAAKPKKSNAMVRLGAADFDDAFRALDAVVGALPPSGRGVMVLVRLGGWGLAADASATAVDAMFSRLRIGKRRMSAGLGLRFDALSLKDPEVATTIANASRLTGLKFGKPMAALAGAAAVPTAVAPVPAVAPDPRLQPPSPQARMVVLQCFDEAMARSADQVGARPEDLREIPLLFSRGGGFEKRMKDIVAGKMESINLTARLKRFMREQFPGYASDAAGAEQVWFRKPVAPTLDLLLMFDKVHQWGLGKSFSIDFGADFPNTPLGGMHTGYGGTRKNLFWMFHQGWEKQVWAYTTSGELEVALQSCGDLLRRVLPALERHTVELLLPPPETPPAGIERRGALSARDAYKLVLPLARAWAGDPRLENIASSSVLTVPDPAGSFVSSIGDDGRLRPAGSWTFKFLSERLEQYCSYSVPHTGRVWWNFYPLQKGVIPRHGALLETEDWIDSTEVAAKAFEALRQRTGDFRAHQLWLSLRDPQTYSGRFVWEARCIAFGAAAGSRRDVSVETDLRTGEIVVIVGRGT